ncbi:hypothetical protein ACN28E_24615 [Archangium lansingense]|uniref:hypothetical protein n=1 Tax=Archangium lansingense TaxID=2995310 RepID=UPI003B7C0F34
MRYRRLVRPEVGELVFETSVLSVDDSDGLSLFVLSPADDASARGVEQLLRDFTR